MADEQNSNLAESVRETLASRSTEKALNNLKREDARTDAQKAASAKFFAEKNRKKRKRPWK
jgi:hypothetical protein